MKWHLIGSTWDGSIHRLYLDGVEVASGPYAGSIGTSDKNSLMAAKYYAWVLRDSSAEILTMFAFTVGRWTRPKCMIFMWSQIPALFCWQVSVSALSVGDCAIQVETVKAQILYEILQFVLRSGRRLNI